MSVFASLLNKQPIAEEKVKDITSQALKVLLDQEDVLLIDVRERHEHLAQSIEGDLLIPLSSFSAADVPATKGKKIVFYCRSGIRSKTACRLCSTERPKEEIYNLEGGINKWKNQGLPCLQEKERAQA